MTKKPVVDEPTLRLMGALVRMPPKPHDEMKIGKAKKISKKKAPKWPARKS